MMIALAIALVVGTVIALVLIQRLRAKPWTEIGVVPASQDTMDPAPKVGLWVLLAAITSLFALFTAAYLMRMGHGHGGELHDWQAISKPLLLWFNTAVLILASVAMQRAKRIADAGDLVAEIDRLRGGFTLAGILTLVFLAGQFWAWLDLRASGQYSASMPAYAFFILLTSVHAVHLLGGLLVWTKTATRVWVGIEKKDLERQSRIRLSVQLCTVYWHYLLLVWLALFILLLLT
jgi:cytochrome c oxidase subunit III